MNDIYQKQKREVLEIFHQAMDGMHPKQLMKANIQLRDQKLIIQNTEIPLNGGKKIWVIGTGKASVAMATGVENVLEEFIQDGILITPEGTNINSRIIQSFKGDHPVPGINSLASTYELVEFVKKIPSNDILVYCLSGGTSALLCLPAEGLELEDLQNTYQLLLESGANIHEMNIVRKQLSAVKGGKLLQYLKSGVQVINLVISDVPNNKLEDIGSAPTIPKETGFSDAWEILNRYNLMSKLPKKVSHFIEVGVQNEKGKAPKKEKESKNKSYTFLLSSADLLARNAGDLAKRRGYNIQVSEKPYNDDVRSVARKISAQAISVLSRDNPVKKPAVLIHFGESTVHIEGDGLGGRNQELALAVALSVEGQHYITILSVGTDGIDGPTDAAGAISTSNTALMARKKGLDPESYLQNNDSYHFFEQMDGLVKTGPTGNNLMDLQIVMVTS